MRISDWSSDVCSSDLPPRGVKHARLGPGHAFHHHQPQRMAGHVHAVTQRIGAERRGMAVVAENIDQRAGIDRIDMLRVERQPLAREPVRSEEHTSELQSLMRIADAVFCWKKNKAESIGQAGMSTTK